MGKSKQKTEISNKTKALASSYASRTIYSQKIEKLLQELKSVKERLENTPSEAAKTVEKIIKNDIELMYIKHKIHELSLSESSERVATIRADNQRLREALAKVTRKSF